MGQIEYFYPHPIKIDEESTSDWITAVVAAENDSIQTISLHFLSRSALREINKDHLAHDYETDVITFDHSIGRGLCADIMISPDNVAENASDLGVSFKDELDRVMVHGILHLLDYDDKEDDQRRVMREKEDHYLTLRPS